MAKAGFKKVKLLGGEPTIRSDLPQIISRLKLIPEMEVSMITNGTTLVETAEELKIAGLDRINVSLNTLDGERYQKYYGGSEPLMQRVISGIDKIIELGYKPKINFVYLKNFNDNDLLQVLDFVREIKLELNVLNLLHSKKTNINSYFVSSAELMEKFFEMGVKKASIKKCPLSLNMLRLELDHGASVLIKHHCLGQYNFLNACENCSVKAKCTEGIFAIRLTEKGAIKPCLFRDDINLDLKAISQINSPEAVDTIVEDYLKAL